MFLVYLLLFSDLVPFGHYLDVPLRIFMQLIRFPKIYPKTNSRISE